MILFSSIFVTRSPSTRSNNASYKRTQVWVDLVLQVARKKSQTLTGLDRGPGQDDPGYLLLEQSVDRHRNGEKALSGTRHADPENKIVCRDRVEILPLVRCLWRDLLLA